jgi:hypothetical protein
VILRKLAVLNAKRIFFIRHALCTGFTVGEILNLTKSDRWFLVLIKEIVSFRVVFGLSVYPAKPLARQRRAERLNSIGVGACERLRLDRLHILCSVSGV